MEEANRIQRLIELWREIMKPDRSWVLFEHGTCVVCTNLDMNPEDYAIEILREWGPVVPGSSAGDFNPGVYDNPPGILVTYHHPDILTFIPKDEIEDPDSPYHLAAGLVARHKRGEDAKHLNIVHVEHSKTTS